MLAAAGIDPNSADQGTLPSAVVGTGMVPLATFIRTLSKSSATHDPLDRVAALLQAGADVTATSHFVPVLDVVVWSFCSATPAGRVALAEVAALLVRHGANTAHATAGFRFHPLTPLQQALLDMGSPHNKLRHEEWLPLLAALTTQQSANVAAPLTSLPLVSAVVLGCAEIVCLLLAAGANPSHTQVVTGFEAWLRSRMTSQASTPAWALHGTYTPLQLAVKLLSAKRRRIPWYTKVGAKVAILFGWSSACCHVLSVPSCSMS